MIQLSTALAAALLATENKPVDLYEFVFPDGTHVNLADRDITWNGTHYLPYVESRSDIRRYMRDQFDDVSVTIANVDNYLAILLANHDIEGGTLTIRKVDVTVTDDSMPLFYGLLQLPGAMDEMRGVLSAKEYLGGIDYDAPGRLFSPSCPFPFKGPECGYVGSATSCDQSWSNCTLNANTNRFGGFRFQPHSGTFQTQEVTRERFLLFFSRKKVKSVSVAFNSIDDTPYNVPIPIVLGRTQMQGIVIEHEDVGAVTFSLVAFCVGPIAFFQYVLANNSVFVGTAGLDRHYGELGGVGSQVPDTFIASYPYNLVAYCGVRIPSDVSTVDPAPAITAVVAGSMVNKYDFTGTFNEFAWTDNPIWNTRHFLTLSAAQGGLGLPDAWFDDVANFAEAVYCDEYITDSTNDQKIYSPSVLPDGFTVGGNYQRYRSTGVQGYDPSTDGPYSDFVAGVDDDTSRSPAPVQMKRFTLNVAIAQQAAAIDILQQKLLPAFRGFTRQNKAGKIQICVEKANPHSAVTVNSVAGATSIYCDTPSSFAPGDLLILSTFTTRAEVATVASVASDHIALTSPVANAHLAGEELLKVAMYFHDSNVVSNRPIQYPLSDRQSSYNRVTVTYVDAPSGFEQRPLQVNDYEHQARVRKVNNYDLDGAGIDSFFQAWRIGQWQRALYRDLGKFIQIPADISASRLEVGDVIAASAAEFGLVCVPFRVIELGFRPDDETDVVGQLYATSVYDDTAPQATLTVPTVFKSITNITTLDTSAPPTPHCAITDASGGTVTFGPITFATTVNTRTVSSAVIVLLCYQESAAPTALLTTALPSGVSAGTACTVDTDTDMTGIAKAGDWLLIGGELIYVAHDATSASVSAQRALGLTTAELHAVGAQVRKLDLAVFTYTFPDLFFGGANAASWGPTEQLQNAVIALSNIVVYNAFGVSPQGPVNYSQSVDGPIHTGSSRPTSLARRSVGPPVSGVVTLDFANGRYTSMYVLLTTDCELSLINVPTGQFLWVLMLEQDSSGGHSVDLGTAVDCTFALTSPQSAPGTRSVAIVMADGTGRHRVISAQVDQ